MITNNDAAASLSSSDRARTDLYTEVIMARFDVRFSKDEPGYCESDTFAMVMILAAKQVLISICPT